MVGFHWLNLFIFFPVCRQHIMPRGGGSSRVLPLQVSQIRCCQTHNYAFASFILCVFPERIVCLLCLFSFSLPNMLCFVPTFPVYSFHWKSDSDICDISRSFTCSLHMHSDEQLPMLRWLCQCHILFVS